MQADFFFAKMTDTIGVARPNDKKKRLYRFHILPLAAPPRCHWAAIWNLKELDVHMQPELLFAPVNDIFGVARPKGTNVRLCRCHISPLSAPPRCQMAAIWNLKGLDVYMQPELLFANVNDVFGVARPKGTKTRLCQCQMHIKYPGIPDSMLPLDNEEVQRAGGGRELGGRRYN